MQHLDYHAADGKAEVLRQSYPDVTTRFAARTTVGASRRPGVLPIRSTGPLTLIAATTAPPAPSTGALTLATPASRSPTLSAQPRRRTVASTVDAMSKESRSSAHARSTLPP